MYGETHSIPVTQSTQKVEQIYIKSDGDQEITQIEYVQYHGAEGYSAGFHSFRDQADVSQEDQIFEGNFFIGNQRYYVSSLSQER